VQCLYCVVSDGLCLQVVNPFYVFQIFSIILWCCDNYYIYAGCIFVISLISLAVELYETRKVCLFWAITAICLFVCLPSCLLACLYVCLSAMTYIFLMCGLALVCLSTLIYCLSSFHFLIFGPFGGLCNTCMAFFLAHSEDFMAVSVIS